MHLLLVPLSKRFDVLPRNEPLRVGHPRKICLFAPYCCANSPLNAPVKNDSFNTFTGHLDVFTALDQPDHWLKVTDDIPFSGASRPACAKHHLVKLLRLMFELP
jgi:hypothetical protein